MQIDGIAILSESVAMTAMRLNESDAIEEEIEDLAERSVEI